MQINVDCIRAKVTRFTAEYTHTHIKSSKPFCVCRLCEQKRAIVLSHISFTVSSLQCTWRRWYCSDACAISWSWRMNMIHCYRLCSVFERRHWYWPCGTYWVKKSIYRYFSSCRVSWNKLRVHFSQINEREKRFVDLLLSCALTCSVGASWRCSDSFVLKRSISNIILYYCISERKCVPTIPTWASHQRGHRTVTDTYETNHMFSFVPRVVCMRLCMYILLQNASLPYQYNWNRFAFRLILRSNLNFSFAHTYVSELQQHEESKILIYNIREKNTKNNSRISKQISFRVETKEEVDFYSD